MINIIVLLRCILIPKETSGVVTDPAPLLYGAEAAAQLVNMVTHTTHLSTDLSSDWQLPDSESSGLMKASSIWTEKEKRKQ